MRKRFYFFAFMFCIYASHAQNLEQFSKSRQFTDIRSNLVLNGFSVGNNRNGLKVDGSPYLFKSWNNPSKIVYGDKVYIVAIFNYNIYSERFEAKLSEDSLFIINPRDIKKVIINGKVFGRYLDPDFYRNSYFEEIAKINDDNLLLKKYTVKIMPGPINPLTKEKLGNDRLVKGENYYICDLKDENKLKKIKLKKSTVQSLFNKEVLGEIKKYVNNNDLNYRNPEDVKKILQFYNTL